MTGPLTPRTTIYNGIQMRSRLEAGFAAWLDKYKIEWEYEPHAFADEHGQYLPDFRLTGLTRLWTDKLTVVYVEVKPDSFLSADPFAELDGKVISNPTWEADRAIVSRQAALVRASHPGAELVLAQPGGCSVLKPFEEGGYFPRPIVFVGFPGDVKIAAPTIPPFADEYWRLGDA